MLDSSDLFLVLYVLLTVSLQVSVAVLLDNFISASAHMEAEERVAAAEKQSRCCHVV